MNSALTHPQSLQMIPVDHRPEKENSNKLKARRRANSHVTPLLGAAESKLGAAESKLGAAESKLGAVESKTSSPRTSPSIFQVLTRLASVFLPMSFCV